MACVVGADLLRLGQIVEDLTNGQKVGQRSALGPLSGMGRNRDLGLGAFGVRRSRRFDLGLVEQPALFGEELLALRGEALGVHQPLPLAVELDQLGELCDRRPTLVDLGLLLVEHRLLREGQLAERFGGSGQLGARHARTIPQATCYATDSDEESI